MLGCLRFRALTLLSSRPLLLKILHFISELTSAFAKSSMRTILVSMCSESTSQSGRRLPKSSIVRSRQGCATCRKRRVKCDEVQPRCGPCTRLYKDCDWARSWRFETYNPWLSRSRKDRASASPDECNESDNPTNNIGARWKRHELVAKKVLASTVSTDSANVRTWDEKAMTQPPGTFNLILTPDNFATCHDLPASSSTRPAQQRSPGGTNCNNIDDAEWMPCSNPNRKKDSLQPESQGLCEDMLQDENGDGMELVFLYKTVVSASIMPLAAESRLMINSNNEDIIVAAAKDFPPLHHAICAITIQSAAVQGRSELLVDALRHYDQAISACFNYSDIYSSRFFYLHWLLLLYDLCCEHQSWSAKGHAWTQHLDHLATITFSNGGLDLEPFQLHLVWHILILDTRGSLVGNPMCGSFVRAFVAKGHLLPRSWPGSLGCQSVSTSEAAIRGKLQDANNQLFGFAAEMSLMAATMRNDCKTATPQTVTKQEEGYSPEAGELDEEEEKKEAYRHEQIAQLSNRLQNTWTAITSESLLSGFFQVDYSSTGSDTHTSSTMRSSLAVLSLQFSAWSLYLHTSMYPRQQRPPSKLFPPYPDQFQEEDAQHCTSILRMSCDHPGLRYHMEFAIFLAGVVSKNEQERALAVQLMRHIEATGTSHGKEVGRQTLEVVQYQQAQRGVGYLEEVDWVELGRQNRAQVLGM